TGGTSKALRSAGIAVKDVSTLTNAPEILGGRVKSLHPNIHGGILHRRNDADDLAELEDQDIRPIDLVVVNLYPFEEATRSAGVTDSEAVENIDIGGPTMLRAAAKNYFFTGVVVDPADYPTVASELTSSGGMLSLSTRRNLAAKGFARTAAYEAAIARYFAAPTAGDRPSEDRSRLSISLPRAQTLRYGENPHQDAALYGEAAPFEVLHGKELSYNNLLDVSAAIQLIGEFDGDDPTVAILKHTNPCGVARSSSLLGAWHQAFATDQQSPFGGIVVVNQSLDVETAAAIDAIFTEIIIAPAFDEDALALLKAKKNRRLVLNKQQSSAPAKDVRSVVGGILVQDADAPLPRPSGLRAQLSVSTTREPSESEWRDLDFAWRIVKHVKSNAIVYVKNEATIGIGAGQMSRIDASEIAVAKGKKSGCSFEGCVVASDAFFPFADGLIAAAEAGARAAIQPGGSVRDAEVIAAA
ncbi:MAG: bifunctional phosphoribosylaminoimidazolecarboxamide formyltransferase/IMP cyclohydrolase PurH, partial [Bacteroidetes bacterium]|nr:bifunctional phosphoribosylaminoimidazolecarboxamide formyltransferase/IMP cyclohydrolase PurH [Bacteroidota bacterium]